MESFLISDYRTTFREYSSMVTAIKSLQLPDLFVLHGSTLFIEHQWIITGSMGATYFLQGQ